MVLIEDEDIEMRNFRLKLIKRLNKLSHTDRHTGFSQHEKRETMIVRYHCVFRLDFRLCIDFKQLVVGQVQNLVSWRKRIAQLLDSCCLAAADTGVNQDILSLQRLVDEYLLLVRQGNVVVDHIAPPGGAYC